MNKIFLSRGVRFDTNGQQQDIDINPADQGFTQNLGDQIQSSGMAAIMDGLNQTITPIAPNVATLVESATEFSQYSYLSENNDGTAFIQSNVEEAALWTSLETQIDNGTEIEASHAIAAIATAAGTEKSIYIEYEKPQSLGESIMGVFSDGEPEIIRAELNQEIIQKIMDGDIENAKLTVPNDYITNLLESNGGLTMTNPNDTGHSITIEDGKITHIANGMEDQIPQVVLDFAKENAVHNSIALTVQNVIAFDQENGEMKNQYQLVDDNGKPMIFDIKVGPDNKLLPIINYDEAVNMVNAPAGNSPGGQVGKTHDVINPVNTKSSEQTTPEINESIVESTTPAQKEVLIFENRFDLPEENLLLAKGNTEPNLEVIKLQNQILELAHLDENIPDDILGDYSITAEEANKVGFHTDVTPPNGVDGYFGNMTEQSVFKIQQSLGMGPTGVADQTLINAMNEKIMELQMQQHAGQDVKFIKYSDGTEIQPANASNNQNTGDTPDVIATPTPI